MDRISNFYNYSVNNFIVFFIQYSTTLSVSWNQNLVFSQFVRIFISIVIQYLLRISDTCLRKEYAFQRNEHVPCCSNWLAISQQNQASNASHSLSAMQDSLQITIVCCEWVHYNNIKSGCGWEWMKWIETDDTAYWNAVPFWTLLSDIGATAQFRIIYHKK